MSVVIAFSTGLEINANEMLRSNATTFLDTSSKGSIHMHNLHAEKRHLGLHVPLVSTLTWDSKARTSILLAELFMLGLWGLMGGSGKLQYSLSLEPPKFIIKPLRP